jgi:uncharacterized membrane-anchored protein
MTDLRSTVYLVVGFLWIVLEAGVAAVAFCRFRATAAGILLGGAFGLMAVKGLAMNILFRFVLNDLRYPDPKWVLFQSVSQILSLLLLVAVAVGIAMIPRSLRQRLGVAGALPDSPTVPPEG